MNFLERQRESEKPPQRKETAIIVFDSKQLPEHPVQAEPIPIPITNPNPVPRSHNERGNKLWRIVDASPVWHCVENIINELSA